jgi:carbonic anhydrase
MQTDFHHGLLDPGCDAWARNQVLAVHGWIYGVDNGLLRDLNMCVTGEAELAARYDAACAAFMP